MQVKNWKKMLQTSENCNNIQEPTNKQNLENLDSDEKSHHWNAWGKLVFWN